MRLYVSIGMLAHIEFGFVTCRARHSLPMMSGGRAAVFSRSRYDDSGLIPGGEEDFFAVVAEGFFSRPAGSDEGDEDVFRGVWGAASALRTCWIFSLYASLSEDTESWPSLVEYPVSKLEVDVEHGNIMLTLWPCGLASLCTYQALARTDGLR